MKQIINHKTDIDKGAMCVPLLQRLPNVYGYLYLFSRKILFTYHIVNFD